MKLIAIFSLLCCLTVSVYAQQASSPCTPSAAVETDLKQMNFNGLVETNLEQRRRVFRELLRKYPDDLFVHRRAIETVFLTSQHQALVDEYRKLAEEHPKSLQFEYLYARALQGTDTPQAIQLLKHVESEDAHYPWPYLEFAKIHSYGKWTDFPQARIELDQFFKECPASLDRDAWSMVARHGTPEMAAHYGPLLRERLLTETDRDRLRFYKTLWTLDFKAVPVAKHPEIRAQVKQDLLRLEHLPGNADARWLELLKTGYALAEDPEDVKRVENELLAKYPNSDEATQILSDNFQEEHPPLEAGASEEQKQAYYRALLQFDDQLLKASPRSSYFHLYRFMWLSELNDSTPDQLTQAAHELLKAMETDPIWQASPPVAFQIAETYNKKRIHADQVPQLVEKGLRDEAEQQFTWDGETEAAKTSDRDYAIHLQVEAADLLVGAAQQLKKPQIAADAVKKLDTLAPEKSEDRSGLWAVKGKFAELEGRKLDALLMYQASLKSRAADYVAKKPDEVADKEARLWNDLGGTSAGLTLWENKAKQTVVATESAWTVPSKPMPAWELSDLQGKTWKMQSLQGKTVLIGVWTTWCGPCRAELPQFQKLYDQMRGRPDVQVISFNVDEETEQVEPFIKQQGYTFPVLMARDYVTDLLGEIGIPQTWIVDSTGKWGWEQTGFNSEKEHWLESVIEKTTSVGKAPGAMK